MPTGDGDENPLLRELARRGVAARWQPWGQPPDDGQLVVLRATWDYADRLEPFLDWCATVPRLANPYKVVAGNLDKRYLAQLAAAGLPVIPTAVHEVGAELDVPAADFVIKPVVGAGSRGAGRFTARDAGEARAHLRELHARGLAALVQPYQASVDEQGETSLIFFHGRYSHAFTKGPMLKGGRVDTGTALYLEERLGPARPDADMIGVGAECLAAAAHEYGVTGEQLLYARVDMTRGRAGPELLELELAEPSLCLRFGGPAAYSTFADAIESLL